MTQMKPVIIDSSGSTSTPYRIEFLDSIPVRAPEDRKNEMKFTISDH
jgi:hypothetical protein